VTPVVRDPARHGGGAVAGDVTDPAGVARGHDVAISAVYSADADPETLYGDGTRALLAGLEQAGVRRLLIVGLATTLRGGDGRRLFEAPDFPAAWRPFSLARVAELEVLEAYRGPVDWTVCTPPMGLVADESGTFGYTELARAVLDEVVSPQHHRVQYAIGG
jgi:putative NADH-flavin reductase